MENERDRREGGMSHGVRRACVSGVATNRQAFAPSLEDRPVEAAITAKRRNDIEADRERMPTTLLHGVESTAREAVSDEQVNHPKHYTSGEAKCSSCGHPIECIDVVEHMGFARGNAVKYCWRGGLKGDEAKHIEDIKKAIWYLTREVTRLEKKNA